MSPGAALEWTRTAQALAIHLLSGNKDETAGDQDEWVEFARKTEIAKSVIGAAEAIGLVKSEGVLDEESRRRGEWVARETSRLRGTPEALTKKSGWTHDAALSKGNAEGTSQWQTQVQAPGSSI